MVFEETGSFKWCNGPRHLKQPPQLGESHIVQINDIRSTEIDLSLRRVLPPTTNVHSINKSCTDIILAAEQTWGNKKTHILELQGRDENGYSVYVEVISPLFLALELPRTHDDNDSVNLILNTFKGLIIDHQLCRGETRSNFFIPDFNDWKKAREYSILRLQIRNKDDYRYILERVQEKPFMGKNDFQFFVTPHETIHDISPDEQFLLEYNFSMGRWYDFKNIQSLKITNKTTCDYEFFIENISTDMIQLTERNDVCKTCTMSFDLETINGTLEEILKMMEIGLSKFPNHQNETHQIIQNSVSVATVDGRKINYLLELCSEPNKPPERRKFQDSNDEYLTIFFDYEQALLLYFRDLIIYYDPDIITSFNGDYFDWPYLFGRHGILFGPEFISPFHSMGRKITDEFSHINASYYINEDGVKIAALKEDEDNKNVINESVPVAFASTIESFQLTPKLNGRILLDLRIYIDKLGQMDGNFKFQSTKLKNVSKRFLDDSKIDFDHNDIFAAWNGIMQESSFKNIVKGYTENEIINFNSWFPMKNNGATYDQLETTQITKESMIHLLGDYCMKDTLLLIRIIEKLDLYLLIWEIARLARVSQNKIVNCGQLNRVNMAFMIEARKDNRFLNYVPLHNINFKVEGAIVLEPKRGYYGGADENTPLCEEQPTEFPKPRIPDCDLEEYDISDLEDLLKRVSEYCGLTLDFKSLYPMINMSHHLCISNYFDYLKKDVTESRAEQSATAYLQKRARDLNYDQKIKPVLDKKSNVPELKRSFHEKYLQYKTLRTKIQKTKTGNERVQELANINNKLKTLAQQIGEINLYLEIERERKFNQDFINYNEMMKPHHDKLMTDPSQKGGVIKDLPDAEIFETVLIVSRDPVLDPTRRIHKYWKHHFGLAPSICKNYLDQRKIKKKKMQLCDGSLGVIEVFQIQNSEFKSNNGRIMTAEEFLQEFKKVQFNSTVEEQLQILKSWLLENDNNLNDLLKQLNLEQKTMHNAQMACKIGANSVYGGTAYFILCDGKKYYVCCSYVGESTTQIGRSMIHQTRDACDTLFKEKFGTDTTYGDTDSVMCLIKEADDKIAWKINYEIAEYCTKVLFKGTKNVLEPEQIKRDWYLGAKKNYACRTNDEADQATGIYKQLSKGISVVRRDKPAVLNKLIAKLLDCFTQLGGYLRFNIAMILLRICIDHFEKMLDDRFPIDDYTIHAKVKARNPSSPHIQMAMKLKERADIPIQRNDTIAFIFIVDPSKSLQCERVESPIMIKRDPGKFTIDKAYYFSNRIFKAVETMLSLFLPPEVLIELFNKYDAAFRNQKANVKDLFVKDPKEFRKQSLEQLLIREKDRIPVANELPELKHGYKPRSGHGLILKNAAPKLTNKTKRKAIAEENLKKKNDCFWNKLKKVKP